MSEKSVFGGGLESWNDVTIIPSLLFLVARFCTPPEVKFDAFGTSKHGEGIAVEFFFCYTYQYIGGDLIEQINKICHIHFNEFPRILLLKSPISSDS